MAEPATILEVLEKEKERQDNGELVKPVHDRAQPYSWGLRNYVQLAVFLVTIGIGIHFFIYYLQASGDGAITVSRPAGVEGFLPIGALMGWKDMGPGTSRGYGYPRICRIDFLNTEKIFLRLVLSGRYPF